MLAIASSMYSGKKEVRESEKKRENDVKKKRSIILFVSRLYYLDFRFHRFPLYYWNFHF